MTHSIAIFAWIWFYVACRGRIRHRDRIRKAAANGPFIIAANHVSYLDWMVLWGVFRYSFGIRLIFPAKEKLFRHWIWGCLMRHSRAIMVNDQGTKILGDTSREELREAYIAIFPEGTRSRDGQLGGFRKGVLYFSRKYKKDIVPVGLDGFFDAWPPGRRLPRPRRMRIHIGDSISHDEISITSRCASDVRKRVEILSGGGNDSVLGMPVDYQLAIFDVDGTLAKTNIVDLLLYIRRRDMPPLVFGVWKTLFMCAVAPLLLVLDRVSRPLVQVIIYSAYQRESRRIDLGGAAAELFAHEISRSKILADSDQLLRRLEKGGCRICLVSTNLDFVVRQFAEHYDVEALAVSLEALEQMSFFEKLKYLRSFKEDAMDRLERRWSFASSIGIGDSAYDIPVLGRVSRALVRSRRKAFSRMGYEIY